MYTVATLIVAITTPVPTVSNNLLMKVFTSMHIILSLIIKCCHVSIHCCIDTWNHTDLLQCFRFRIAHQFTVEISTYHLSNYLSTYLAWYVAIYLSNAAYSGNTNAANANTNPLNTTTYVLWSQWSFFKHSAAHPSVIRFIKVTNVSCNNVAVLFRAWPYIVTHA